MRASAEALARFCWIALWVNRVNARSLQPTITSVASAGERSTMRRAIVSRSSARIADPDRNVTEACRRRALRGPPGLQRLSLSAVRRPPGDPRGRVGDRIAGVPKLRRDACVCRIFDHTAPFAVLDLPPDLAAELKVEAVIVDRPRAVRLHVQPFAHVLEERLEGAVAREQHEIAHPDHRDVAPALRAHAGVRRSADRLRRIARHLEADQDPVADDIRLPAFRPFVVVADRREPSVELGRMAARLVDLQRHLRAAEDHVHLAGRRLRCREEPVRFFSDTGRVFAQPGLFDDLPAAGLIEPDVAGERALLRIVFGDREGADPTAALDDRLLDARAGRTEEFLLGSPKIDPGLPDADALLGVQKLLDVEEVGDSLTERNSLRISRDRCREAVDIALGRRLRKATVGDASRRLRDRDRSRSSAIYALVAHVVGSGEPPGSLVEGAYPVAAAPFVGKGRDLAVAHLDPLFANPLVTEVGI